MIKISSFLVALIFIVLSASCNKSTVPYDRSGSQSSGRYSGSVSGWQTTNSAGATQIKAISDDSGETLETNIVQRLTQLGFAIDSNDGASILTEKKYVGNRYMRMSVSYSGSEVIVGGQQGSDSFGNGVDWKTIESTGSNAGSMWWEQLYVFAYAIQDNGLSYK